MGYFKQGNNIILWGTIGKTDVPKVVATRNGNIQKQKFGVCFDITENNEKRWAQVECWGMQAAREDIKQWNTVFLAGKIKTDEFEDSKTKEKITRSYIRADFLNINATAKAFEDITNSRKEEAQEPISNDTPNAEDDDFLPF